MLDLSWPIFGLYWPRSRILTPFEKHGKTQDSRAKMHPPKLKLIRYNANGSRRHTKNASAPSVRADFKRLQGQFTIFKYLQQLYPAFWSLCYLGPKDCHKMDEQGQPVTLMGAVTYKTSLGWTQQGMCLFLANFIRQVHENQESVCIVWAAEAPAEKGACRRSNYLGRISALPSQTNSRGWRKLRPGR